ncbi:YraN family protein [Hymenobacter sp. 5516J-16]|uniref:YraN family protein n=1 Tax=Hymenobacter sp. 5516J-16 TaxID=2932253 RepID=UPI001FD4973D|nr:YraN family protein [Hymenobacter sp. 5516J-16]UOQ75680.1 YraN family protein [Hymenobacter sp. 5516J-16]
MRIPSHQLGHDGEEIGLRYLLAQGYELVYRNYRYRRAEVDLIVRQGTQLLVFVEVKTRSSVLYGHPEEFVTERKRQLLRLAAEQVQEQLQWRGDIRFDILALQPTHEGLRVEHFQDAFY